MGPCSSVYDQPHDAPLILVDWGTSRLRAYLCQRGAVLERRTGPGIGSLTTEPLRALQQVIEAWLQNATVKQILLCGMAGSRNGIVEVPYATAPTTLAQWRQRAAILQQWNAEILIAAGIQGRNLNDAPDVMRGEETQIFGALDLDATLRSGRHLFVLPGTHSKWVVVEDGCITSLHTAFTGELHDLLVRHSILFKTAAPQGDAIGGFEAGLARIDSGPAGLLGALFEARSAQLIEARSPQWAQAFLSGLLIGSEVREMSARFGTISRIVLIGSRELCVLYEQAMQRHAIGARILDADDCVIAGLITLTISNTRTL